MSQNMHYSLLDDPIIGVRYNNDQVTKVTLPEVFSQLVDDNILAFEALQPHQQQPWFSFLVQLAAMTVAREANGSIPSNTSAWKELLIKLADGKKSAWHLVVENVSQPAFMQSPIPEGSLDEAGYKSDINTPDELDMLVTSKNHDVKGNRILRPDAEHWLFALLTLQTMEGFLGRGNYGIVRMNGGFGNRPFVGLSPSLSWGKRFNRDLHVLLQNREQMLDLYNPEGHALLWLESWDGGKNSGIPINKCDPYFMEICRRVRFSLDNGTLTCWRANTKAARISAPDDLNGQTKDPWTPVEKKGVKALTLGESGFTYELLQQLLLGDEYATPIALEFRKNEQEGAFLVSQALVRGQGKTDGLHRRIIPVPPNVTYRLFADPSEKEKLAARAKQRVSLAGTMQNQVLRPAIAALLSSGTDERVDFEKVAPWIERFDQAIDNRFFESLWNSVEMDGDEARRSWEKVLLEEAEKQLRQAERSTPIAQLRRLKAISKARSIFYSRVQNEFEISSNQTVAES